MPKKFLDDANETLLKLSVSGSQAGWVAQNFITDDTEALDARGTQQLADAGAKFAKESTRFDKVQLPADQRRQLDLLKVSLVLATPADPKEAEELTQLNSRMRAAYGKGKWCPDPAKPDTARTSTRSRRSSPVRETKRSCAASGKAGTRSRRRCARTTRASSSCRTRARRSSASPTPARCGARNTTCRPTTSRRSSIGSGIRCGRSISSSTRTCA